MRRWYLAVAGVLLFGGGFGSALLLNQFRVSEIAVTELPTDQVIEVTEIGPKLRINGKVIKGQTLLQAHLNNPNKFNNNYSKGSYQVIGKIAKIGEVSTLDQTSGFYIPLNMEKDIFANTIRSGLTVHQVAPSPNSISIWLLGVNQKRAATLEIGQDIAASCRAVRVVGGGLTFDECEELKE